MSGINTTGYQSGKSLVYNTQNGTQRFDRDRAKAAAQNISFGTVMTQKELSQSIDEELARNKQLYGNKMYSPSAVTTVDDPAWCAGGITYTTPSDDCQINRAMNGQGAVQRTYQVYMKTDDMLYSGGNGSGLSFYIKYAEGSTEEDPVVVAKGVDEYGREFEQTIHINKINPKHATVVEMHALEAYLGVDKNGGMTSLPMDPSVGDMGLNDKADFIGMFQKVIQDMNVLGQRGLAAYYRYSMQMYENFMKRS